MDKSGNWKTPAAWSLAIVAVAGIAVYVAAAGWTRLPGGEARSVHLSGPVSPAVVRQSSPDEVRVAVAALLSPRRSLAAYARLLDLLAYRLGRPVRMVSRRTYSEVNELLVKGDVAFGFICSGAYVAVEGRGVEAIAVPVVGGKRTYQSYIIVRPGLDARSLDDLAGRPFALADPLSNTGCLYPSSVLAGRGLTPATFFSRVVWTWGHEGSIEAVTSGAVDGAAVDGLTYEFLRGLDPSLGEQARVISVSPLFGISPVVASPRTPTALRDQVRAALLAAHTTEEGRAALDAIGFDRYEEARPADYDSVRAMRDAVRAMEAR